MVLNSCTRSTAPHMLLSFPSPPFLFFSFWVVSQHTCGSKENGIPRRKQIEQPSTLDDRNGETYTLCVADTFFGDISGRLGNGDILGDPGH